MALPVRLSRSVLLHNAPLEQCIHQHTRLDTRSLTEQARLHFTRGKSRTFKTSSTLKKPPPSNRILVVGGGPAGCTTAFFLAKAGFDVTVAERSTRSPYGQGIDVTDQAVDVVKRMGLLDKIKSETTGETGFALLDDGGRQIGSLLGTNAAQRDSTQSEESPSLTNEIEIMRGTLNKILAEAAKQQGVNFRYGCTITDIQQRVEAVDATLSDNKQAETFTAIIGADGVNSVVRQLAFPRDMIGDILHPTNTYTAYFSMDMGQADRHSYSRLQHGGQGRAIWIRPIDRDGTRASGYFITTTPTSSQLETVSDSLTTVQQQQSKIAELHADMKGIGDIFLQGMRASDDWHFARLVQVKLPTWHVDRCALVGDAAYCPTPLTGQGTSMALIGSYVLAGELAAHPGNPAAAFAEYKRKFDPYVKAKGVIPFGGKAPNLFIPRSRLMVWILRQLYRGFSNGYGRRLFKMMTPGEKKERKFEMPVYSFTR